MSNLALGRVGAGALVGADLSLAAADETDLAKRKARDKTSKTS